MAPYMKKRVSLCEVSQDIGKGIRPSQPLILGGIFTIVISDFDEIPWIGSEKLSDNISFDLFGMASSFFGFLTRSSDIKGGPPSSFPIDFLFFDSLNFSCL
mmetsp:Transcript_24208/g.35386  ORF Transcript_24208/g.35386 Transcript_24208/m.35386 type:complete len:101 (-) Transcript_24208:321-623(-)